MVIGFIIISGEGQSDGQINVNLETGHVFLDQVSDFGNSVLIISCSFCFVLFCLSSSNFGAQMVARFKKFEEIGALMSSRGGFGLWNLWDLDQVWRQRGCCGQFLQFAFMDGSDLCVLVWSSGLFLILLLILVVSFLINYVAMQIWYDILFERVIQLCYDGDASICGPSTLSPCVFIWKVAQLHYYFSYPRSLSFFIYLYKFWGLMLPQVKMIRL